MTYTPGPWRKSYDLGTYEIRADGGVVVAKDCTKENAEAIASMPDMLAALKYNLMILYDAHPEPEQRRYALTLALTLEAIAKAEGRTAHAWDQMCKAGYAAREVLKRIDGQEEPR